MAGASPLLVALAAFCWGLAGGIGGVLLANGWEPVTIAFYRGAIGLLFVFAWLLWHPRRTGLGVSRLWFWAAVAGLGVAGNFVFYFLSVSEGSVAVAATLMYSAPVFVYVVSFLLGVEYPSAEKGVAIALVLLGIVLLTQFYDIGEKQVTALGVAAGLCAGLSYALFIFGFKYAARHGSPPAVLSIAFVVLVAALAWADAPLEAPLPVNTADWPLFLVLGLVGGGLSFVLYLIGLRATAPALASIVAMVEPVTASLFGVLVLHEALAVPQLVGMGLILVTVTVVGARSARGEGAGGHGPAASASSRSLRRTSMRTWP